MSQRTARLLLAGVVAAGLAAASSWAQERKPMSIKRSDVVFMGSSSVEAYSQYGTTVVSWGGRPWGDTERATDQFRQRVKAARELGIGYLPGAAFRTALRLWPSR